MIRDSSILFISVRTFNYEKFIIQKLENLGAKVVFFDERPRNNFIVKGLIRIKKEFYLKTDTIIIPKSSGKPKINRRLRKKSFSK